MAGGAACLRFRDTHDENNVQTLCVVVFDEMGECTGLPGVVLDLKRFLDPNDAQVGANLLESGDGLFYAACQSPGGSWRFQPSKRDLPPLYFYVVDALGGGAYSLGPDEYARQRRGTVTTYSGEEIRPGWVTFLGGGGIGRIDIDEQGRVTAEFPDCAISPECTEDPDFVLPGDIVQIGPPIPDPGEAIARYEALAPERLDALLERHGITGFQWTEIGERFEQWDPEGGLRHLVDQKIKGFLLARLARLQLLSETLRRFDAAHHLRLKGVTLVLNPGLFATEIDCVVPALSRRSFARR